MAGWGPFEDWESAGFSYPTALALVTWLEQRRDFSSFSWLLDLLSEGQSIDDALVRVYGEDYAQLCRRWANSLPQGANS